MPKPTPHRRTGRRRGAPNGNTNALKHGLYAERPLGDVPAAGNTGELLKPTPHRRTGRRRGAPNGNTNALKHGLYAEHIFLRDDATLDSLSLDNNTGELALARLRLLTLFERQLQCPPEHWIAYERLVAQHLGIVASIIIKNALLGQDRRTAYVTAMEMISQLNQE